jgi:hypothetical protein
MGPEFVFQSLEKFNTIHEISDRKYLSGEIMPKIQTNCPNCGQPIVAEINQVVDVKENPRQKEALLAGGLNLANCQACGYRGTLPVPLVYHDRDKELLLTFNPPDPGKTMEDKERDLAPLLKRVTDSLAPEERKGYLFQPLSMLTMNNMVKNILMADGITEEMIESQQEQMQLLEKLFSQQGEMLRKTIQDNREIIDREFFALFAEIAQRMLASQDPQAIEMITNIQNMLVEETEVGKEIKSESEEIRAATKSLESLGNNLTRSSLLELVIKAPSMERVKALASLVGQAMDYEFFQMFTERIESSDHDKRKELIERRNTLLKVSEEIRKQYENRLEKARGLVDEILGSESLQEGLMNRIGEIDQIFVEALSMELQKAENEKQQDRADKINELLQILQEMTSPPELKVVEQLMEIADHQDELEKTIAGIEEEMMPKVIEYLTSIVGNYDEQLSSGEVENREQLEQALGDLKKVYNAVLNFSMKNKFKS